ncbi:MAG: outer membrane lipoprotein-sorting protein [Desulfobacterales bacterium]|nr:outer membrane lipoprotein-sorting protein [Desulfobacterales bacterium]
MKRMISLSIAGLLIFGANLPAAAEQAPSAQQIIAQADRARGNVDGIVWTADIESNEDGKVQQRSLIIKNRGVNTVAEFTAPAKVKGDMLVMLDRNMWFVKPGLRKPVPISPRQKLMGGASNGDIASTNYAADYDAVLVREEEVDGQPCYLFDLRANNKKTTYDRILYWIRKDGLIGLKAEFFTVTGKRFKTALFRYENSIRTDSGEQPFISRMTIFDEVIKGNVTTLVYREARPQILSEAVFNLNLMIR